MGGGGRCYVNGAPWKISAVAGRGCLVKAKAPTVSFLSLPLDAVEGESDAERVLFSYGFGTSVPSTSRRRMQQRLALTPFSMYLHVTTPPVSFPDQHTCWL